MQILIMGDQSRLHFLFRLSSDTHGQANRAPLVSKDDRDAKAL